MQRGVTDDESLLYAGQTMGDRGGWKVTDCKKLTDEGV